MKISVAMCTYNGTQFLREQLESVAAQTRPPDELVICDDHSSDETCAVVETFAATTTRFPVRFHVNARNLGAAQNFASAIALCEGDVIALADQDDVWRADKLARLEASFERAPAAGLIFTDAEVVDRKLQPLGYRLWQTVNFRTDERAQLDAGRGFALFLTRSIVTGATMAFRSCYRELLLPIPDNPNRIHDSWIALMISAVATVEWIDEPLINYRQHAQQQQGARARSSTLSERAAAARRTTAADYGAAAQQVRLMLERLLKFTGGALRADVRAQLEANIAHLEARDAMPAGRLSRAAIVLRELRTRRYQLYSHGLTSAVKDLFG